MACERFWGFGVGSIYRECLACASFEVRSIKVKELLSWYPSDGVTRRRTSFAFRSEMEHRFWIIVTLVMTIVHCEFFFVLYDSRSEICASVLMSGLNCLASDLFPSSFLVKSLGCFARQSKWGSTNQPRPFNALLLNLI